MLFSGKIFKSPIKTGNGNKRYKHLNACLAKSCVGEVVMDYGGDAGYLSILYNFSIPKATDFVILSGHSPVSTGE